MSENPTGKPRIRPTQPRSIELFTEEEETRISKGIAVINEALFRTRGLASVAINHKDVDRAWYEIARRYAAEDWDVVFTEGGNGVHVLSISHKRAIRPDELWVIEEGSIINPADTTEGLVDLTK